MIPTQGWIPGKYAGEKDNRSDIIIGRQRRLLVLKEWSVPDAKHKGVGIDRGQILTNWYQDNLFEMMFMDTFDLIYAISCLGGELMAQVGFSLVTNSEQK